MFKFPKAPAPFTLPLTTQRLNWQLDVLGWSRNELARRTEVSNSKAAQWVQGKSFLPNRIAVWLEMLTQAMLGLGRPLLWNKDPRVSQAKHDQGVKAVGEAWDPPTVRHDEEPRHDEAA
jgi:transcriptional regulator with XRE-family HTH domain